MLVINKRNQKEGNAIQLENGKFEITFTDGSKTSTVTEGTFKRWYTVVEKEVTTEPVKEENTVSLETVQNDIEMEKQMDAELAWNEQGDQEVQKENDVELPELTEKEIKVLNAMRTNEHNDALLDGETWVFTAIDNSGVPATQARGVISSLVKKGLIKVEYGDKKLGDEDTIGFTELGEKLYDNATGEACEWGGPNLLMENVNTKTRCPECEGFGTIVGEHDGPQPTCPTCKGKGKLEGEIEVGSFVEMVDGTVGKVEDIMGDLATVATVNDEVPVKLDQLKLTDKRPEIKVVTEQPVKKEEPKEVKKPKKQTTPKKEKVEEVEVAGLQVNTEIAEGAKSEKSIHFLVTIKIGENNISFKKACFRKNLQGRITKANVNGEELKGNSISITKVLEPIWLSKEEQKYVKKVINESIKETAKTEK